MNKFNFNHRLLGNVSPFYKHFFNWGKIRRERHYTKPTVLQYRMGISNSHTIGKNKLKY